MSNIPYVSIRSVLYDIYTSMDDQYWDENKMLEWAVKGFRKMSLPAKFQLKNSILAVMDHSALIPKDTRYIVQAVYKQNFDEQDIAYYRELMGLQDGDPGVPDHIYNPDGLPQRAIDALYSRYFNQWKPMKPATSSFIKSVRCNYTVPESLSPTTTGSVQEPQYIPYNLVGCSHEYSIDANCTMTTTLRDGLVYLSYLSYPSNTDGDTLIPDDENLKEALRHYCMYRYWESKSFQHEQASTREREWHLARYQTMAAKATGNLNMPDTGQMEILLNINNRMIKTSTDFDKLFTSLGNHQYNNL